MSFTCRWCWKLFECTCLLFFFLNLFLLISWCILNFPLCFILILIWILLLLLLFKLIFLSFYLSKSFLFKFEILLLIRLEFGIYIIDNFKKLSDTLHIYILERLSLNYSGNTTSHHEASLIYISSYLTFHLFKGVARGFWDVFKNLQTAFDDFILKDRQFNFIILLLMDQLLSGLNANHPRHLKIQSIQLARAHHVLEDASLTFRDLVSIFIS